MSETCNGERYERNGRYEVELLPWQPNILLEWISFNRQSAAGCFKLLSRRTLSNRIVCLPVYGDCNDAAVYQMTQRMFNMYSRSHIHCFDNVSIVRSTIWQSAHATCKVLLFTLSLSHRTLCTRNE